MRKTWLIPFVLMLGLWAACAQGEILRVPAGTRVIGEEAFTAAGDFDGALLPPGLREIGDRAFAGCGLEYVYLPDSLKVLGEGAFDAGTKVYVAADSPLIPVLEAQGRACTPLVMPTALNLKIDPGEVPIGGERTVRVTAEPADADLRNLVWTSGDETVLTVAADGTVHALAGGSTTVRAEAMNGVSASLTVTVHKPVYRALLVAIVNYYSEQCRWNGGDIVLLKEMFSSVTAPDGEPWQITVMYNLHHATLREAMRTVFQDTQEGDVSLFHISSHGDVRAEGVLAGRLKMRNENAAMTYVTYAKLKEWMDEYIRGETVLFLEACSSGSSIDARAGASFCDAGYYVLTSSRYMESCWSNNGNYNYFVQWLTQGVGTSGAMPADVDGDGAVTVGELHDYISLVGDHYVIIGDGVHCNQHTMVYPENSDFVLFRSRGTSP